MAFSFLSDLSIWICSYFWTSLYPFQITTRILNHSNKDVCFQDRLYLNSFSVLTMSFGYLHNSDTHVYFWLPVSTILKYLKWNTETINSIIVNKISLINDLWKSIKLSKFMIPVIEMHYKVERFTTTMDNTHTIIIYNFMIFQYLFQMYNDLL